MTRKEGTAVESCCGMNVRNVVVGLVVVFILTPLHVCGLRDANVRHYEPVFYDHVELGNSHHVIKRSAQNNALHFRFEAYGRTFSTRLRRDANVLHPNLVVETSQQTSPYDVTRVYSGHLDGEPSRVHGVITTSGHFEGKLYTNQETYFIERAEHIFPESSSEFHTVIYRLSDVTFNTTLTSCLHDRLRQRQLEMTLDVKKKTSFTAETDEVLRKDWHQRYSEASNANDDFGHLEDGAVQGRKLHRKARAVDLTKVTCEIYMQADHLFYEKYGSDEDTVIEKMAQYVQAVNTIYQAIDFDSSGSADNIGFIIKKIKIYTNSSETGYKYAGPMSVEYFLDKHSEDDYDDYCLSYLFTYRDFSGGVLGLAWVGDVNTGGGGVCEKHNLYSGVGKSLNTGIVTLLNYGMDVSSAVSQVTFAHEIGHNFGSQHDSDGDPTCAPGGTDGNYVMYAHATSGTLSNNNKMSSCSISSMNTVLEAKARQSGGCFVAQTDAVCGNRVVEGTEACDCGWEEDCTEGCCNPQVSNTTGADTPCTVKAASVCSPSQGPCCDSSCQYVVSGVQCRAASDCQSETFCDGTSAECPASTNVNDTTQCGSTDDYLVCHNGECSGSVCLAYGLESCQCTGSSSDAWTETILCQLCCMNGTCRPSSEIAGMPDAEAVAGSPCNNYGGYCDVFKKCREVDPSGPLAILKQLFLSGEAFTTMKVWLTKHWYVGVAGGVGCFIIIGLVVKCCSKSTKRRVKPKKSGPDSKTTPRARQYRRRSNHVSPDMWI